VNLKDAIKEMTKPKFDNIPADELTLFKISIPVDDHAAEESLHVNLGPLKSLLPTKPLSQLFPHANESHGPTAVELISSVDRRINNLTESRYQRQKRRGGETASVLYIRVLLLPCSL